jgi:hypothetical protein
MSSYANWQPNFKQRYGKFINPLPAENTLADYSEFVAADSRPGIAYNFPVQVSLEHGQTHNTDGTAFALNAAVDSVLQNAQIDGSTIMVRGTIPYDVIAKGKNGAANGNDGGAFWKPTDLKTKSLMQSGEFYREIDMLYGCGTAAAAAANLGVVAASVSGANLAAPQVVRLSQATWAPGIWNSFINGLVDVYQSDGTTIRESSVTVQAVTSSTQTRLQLFKTASAAVVAANDIIVPAGARTKSCVGVQAILENVGSLFGISAATYPMWRSPQYAVGGAMSRAKILQGMARIYPNGLTKGGKLFVNGMTFAELAEEADALQRYTGNTDEVKRQGVENLEYKSPVGNVNVALHRFMKQGISMFIARDVLKRVGSTDLTFSLPGTNQWFYQELSNNAGSEIRIFSNQAPIIEIPYYCMEFTGVVNTGDIASS